MMKPNLLPSKNKTNKRDVKNSNYSVGVLCKNTSRNPRESRKTNMILGRIDT